MTTMIVIAATVAAIAAIWFWAINPLGLEIYLSSTNVTDAQIIRQHWPHRLVEPEWISAPNRSAMWNIYEFLARMCIVGVSWSIIAGGAAFTFGKRRRQTVGDE